MEVHLGADHRGFGLKRELREYLTSLGHTVVDHGTDSAARCDYPVYAEAVGQAVAAADREDVFGIVFCGSGVGIAIAANKVRGVRCVPAWCEHIAEFGRRHNHANVIAFSGDLQTPIQAKRCLDAYLGAHREGERHAARVGMIGEIERRELG
jgi:ribose 5-phosphate isomerase B